MNKYFIIITILFVIILGIGIAVGFKRTNKELTYSANDPNRPIIQTKENSFSFGKINVRDKVEHDFEIKNIGKSDLVLKQVRTSCDCTSAFLIYKDQKSPKFDMNYSNWELSIKPDTNAILRVVYEPSIMPVEGAVERFITLSSNDPKNPKLEFKIAAEVNK